MGKHLFLESTVVGRGSTWSGTRHGDAHLLTLAREEGLEHVNELDITFFEVIERDGEFLLGDSDSVDNRTL